MAKKAAPHPYSEKALAAKRKAEAEAAKEREAGEDRALTVDNDPRIAALEDTVGALAGQIKMLSSRVTDLETPADPPPASEKTPATPPKKA